MESSVVIKRLEEWLDKISFKNIFIIWVLMNVFFALVYFALLHLDSNGVIYSNGTPVQTNIRGLLNLIYFSLVTSTATGFGDLIPIGFSKFVSALEIVSGLLIFGVVISKLISVKQEKILEEIYDLSFEDKVHRLRSSLYMTRSNISSLLMRIDKGKKVSKKSVFDFGLMCTTLHESLLDVVNLTCKTKKNEFTKTIDEFNLELVINSLRRTLEKLKKIIVILNESEVEWKTAAITESISSILNLSKVIYDSHINLQHGKELLYKLEQIRDLNSTISQALQ